MSLAGDRLRRMTAIDTVGIAPAAPIDQVVLTIASVEPLVSDLFLVTLTPAVPAYLARVGPTTPKRARRPFDASVDPTEARKATVRRFGRSHRSRLVLRDDITADERGAMVRNGLSAGPALVLGADTDSGRGRSSARPDHHRGRVGRGRQSSLAASPSIPLARPMRHPRCTPGRVVIV